MYKLHFKRQFPRQGVLPVDMSNEELKLEQKQKDKSDMKLGLKLKLLRQVEVAFFLYRFCNKPIYTGHPNTTTFLCHSFSAHGCICLYRLSSSPIKI